MRTPSMVRLVSAIDVASTTLRRAPGSERALLLLEGQVGVQRVQGDRPGCHRGGAAQQIGARADLPGSREEGEHVALGFGKSALDGAGDQHRDARRAGIPIPIEVADIDGEGFPGRGNDRRAAEKRGNGPGVQRRRHDEERQVLAQGASGVEAERERQVGVEAALVKFIEDDEGHAFEPRIRLQASGENPLGDDLDPRRRRDPPLETDRVADGAPHLLAERAGHPARSRDRRQTPRLQHHDAPVRRQCREKRRRDARGLAGARRGGEHRDTAARECRTQARQSLVHRI